MISGRMRWMVFYTQYCTLSGPVAEVLEETFSGAVTFSLVTRASCGRLGVWKGWWVCRRRS